MSKKPSEYEQDIAAIIRYLKTIDPKLASTENAEKVYDQMKSDAHILAHEFVDLEEEEILKLLNQKEIDSAKVN